MTLTPEQAAFLRAFVACTRWEEACRFSQQAEQMDFFEHTLHPDGQGGARVVLPPALMDLLAQTPESRTPYVLPHSPPALPTTRPQNAVQQRSRPKRWEEYSQTERQEFLRGPEPPEPEPDPIPKGMVQMEDGTLMPAACFKV